MVSSSSSEDDDIVPEGEYVVERIINVKLDEDDGEIKFFIKWKGYDDPAENTWEPEENLKCPELIEQWRDKITLLKSRKPKMKIKRKSKRSTPAKAAPEREPEEIKVVKPSSSEDEVERVERETMSKKKEQEAMENKPLFKDDLEPEFDPFGSDSDDTPKKKRRIKKRARRPSSASARKSRVASSSSTTTSSTDSDDAWGDLKREKQLGKKKLKLEAKMEKLKLEQQRKKHKPALSEESSDGEKEEPKEAAPKPGPKSKTKVADTEPLQEEKKETPRPGPKSKTKIPKVVEEKKGVSDPDSPAGGSSVAETPKKEITKAGPKSKTKVNKMEDVKKDVSKLNSSKEIALVPNKEEPKKETPKAGPKSKTKVTQPKSLEVAKPVPSKESSSSNDDRESSKKVTPKAGPKSKTKDTQPKVDVAMPVLSKESSSSDDDRESSKKLTPKAGPKSTKTKVKDPPKPIEEPKEEMEPAKPQNNLSSILGVELEVASSDDEEEENVPPPVAPSPVPSSPIPPSPVKESKDTPSSPKKTSLVVRYYNDPEKYVPEKIVGVFEYNGLLIYHLKYQGIPLNSIDTVPSEILKHDFPQVVIQFFQERVRLFNGVDFYELGKSS